jgi:hypothetical protein
MLPAGGAYAMAELAGWTAAGPILIMIRAPL